MERIEVNIETGEQKVVQLSPEEVDTILANQPVEVVQIPQEVTRFQARAALYQSGLLEGVEAEIAKPETDMMLKLAWQDALTFKRSSSFITGMAAILELSEEQLDQLFVLAAGIE